MRDVGGGEPRLLEAFVKSAQYMVRLKTQQDIWDHLGRFTTTHLPAAWTAFVQADAGKEILVHHCTLPDADAAQHLLAEEVRAVVADVLDNGFLASQVVLAPDPSMTVFLPVMAEYRPAQVMLIGHQTADPLPRELLDIYLAIADLAGTTLERLNSERELNRHRAHLEELVRERTAELAQAKWQNELILHSVGEGICGLDLDGRITFVNPSAARMLRWEPEELLGRNTHTTFHHTKPDGCAYPEQECSVYASLRTGSPKHVVGEEFVRKDGSRFPVEFLVTPIEEAGRIVGAVMVFRDFTERKAAEEALTAAKISAESAKAEAERANAAKDHFLAVLSHELRTPLTPALMTADAMAADPCLPEPLREDVELIRRSVKMEASLIDDLLDLNRIARGKLDLNMQELSAHAAVDSALEVCRSEADQRGLRLDCRLEASEHHVKADGGRLQQVFWNLLKNAIKFTAGGGSIELRSFNPRPGWLRVEVADTGIGVEPEVIPRLFDAFEQASRQVTRQFGGLGLGLAICKSLVEMHGGGICAESAGPGQGATFIVELPTVTGRELSPAPSRASAPVTTSLRVLVVEDHKPTADLLRKVLARLNHHVCLAHTVRDALQKLREDSFDLLVSDLGLPDGSGHELMRKARQFKPHLRGLALSGYGMEADRQKSSEAGFMEHLVKPVELHALQAAIARIAGTSTV